MAANSFLQLLSLLSLFIYASVRIFHRFSNVTKLPRLNERRPWELSRKPATRRYTNDSWNMMRQAIDRFVDSPFRVSSLDRGETVVLPQRFVPQVSTDPRLSFGDMVSAVTYGHLNTFEMFQMLEDSETNVVQRMVRQGLTRFLAKLTKPLSIHSDLALQNLLPQDTKNWGEVTVSTLGLKVVARLSTLALLGEERCQDDSWTELMIEFIVKLRTAAAVLREFPWFLRRLANTFHPACRSARAARQKAADVVLGEIQRWRRNSRADNPADVELYTLLAWYENHMQTPGGDDAAVTVQLLLSFAAVLTSTDLLCQVILDLAEHPELIQPLRDEISGVISSQGWQKTGLYKLALLDSVIKESQRVKPVQVGLMERRVQEDMTLIDPSNQQPIHLKCGECVMISPEIMRDPTVYTDPETYDGFRFYKLRFGPLPQDKAAGEEDQPGGGAPRPLGRKNIWQLTSLSPDHLGFGVGIHACPGRFFVANEIKIALCHMIMKYDWKLAEEKSPEPFNVGNIRLFDIRAKILVKKREESLSWFEEGTRMPVEGS